MILPGTLNATSSPESASGPLLYAVPGGPILDQSGREVARASLSARQVKALGLMTSGTFGPPSSTSSARDARNQSLANRLRAVTDLAGSTLYTLTWKIRTTPSGLKIYALRASGRRTSVSDLCFERTGWPTPCVVEPGTTPEQVWARKKRLTEATGIYRGNDCGLGSKVHLSGWATPNVGFQDGDPEKHLQRKIAAGVSKNPVITDLSMQARALAGWPTATTRDWKDGGNPDVNVPLNALLGRTVWLAGWSTPMAGTPAQNGNNAAGNNDSSRKTAELVSWGVSSGPARLTVSGAMLTGCSAGMESGGQLSPEHSRWLMGIPHEWIFCGLTAMLSFPKKSRRLSKQQRKK